jgi:coproporphyrinogen III oxidase-like Fe-S oxidoreductase
MTKSAQPLRCRSPESPSRSPMPIPTLKPVTRAARSIYLHIPFCDRKCFYCDFAITKGGEQLKREYVEAICREIAFTAEGERSSNYANSSNQKNYADEKELERKQQHQGDRSASKFQLASPALETVFFGGGTPSLLSVAQIARILRQSEPAMGSPQMQKSRWRQIPVPFRSKACLGISLWE